MPHVVLRTESPLFEVVESLEPFVAKEDDTIWRLRDVYLNAGESHALAECVIVTSGRLERLFVHIAQREIDGSIVVRPYPVPRVDPKPSVKRMVALVAEAIAESHDDAAIDHTTIRSFLSDRYSFAPDPRKGGWDPLLPERGLPRPLDWATIFGAERPIEIEIGSGKGSFLVEAARRWPERSFLSIEWARAYAEHVRDRVRRRDLRNVRVVRADASQFLRSVIPPGSVSVIHIYFPDPWPKKRHRKRRLMTPLFVEAIGCALKSGGEVRFVTDHRKYFEEATGFLRGHPDLEPSEVPDDQMSDPTNYERKYRAEGREIYRAVFRRC